MTEFFPTRFEQDRAVEQLLRGIGNSTKRYSVNFIEGLEGSDHQVSAAMLMGYVDIWIAGALVWIRVSDAGREWLVARP